MDFPGSQDNKQKYSVCFSTEEDCNAAPSAKFDPKTILVS